MTQEQATQTTPEQGGNAPTPGAQAGGERSFSQVELERILDERLKRARGAWLKDLGVDSLEQAKELAGEAVKARDARRSDAEKLAELQKQLSERDAKLRDALLRSAFIAKAAAKFVDADAAYRLADLSKLAVSESGDVTGVDEALAELEKARPYLVATAPNAARPAGPSIGPIAPEGKPKARTDEDRRRDYFGSAGGSFFRGGGVVAPKEK